MFVQEHAMMVRMILVGQVKPVHWPVEELARPCVQPLAPEEVPQRNLLADLKEL